MRVLIVFLLVGFGAQLVDGSLGMAYGITATTMLLITGATAAQASFAVNLAQVGTTFAAALSHWKFQNVDWKTVLGLGVPGAVGAFIGATVLSNISTKAAQPLMTSILLILGVCLLLRFGLGLGKAPVLHLHEETRHRTSFLAPVGALGGFISATGGGGWGPITATTLMTSGKTTPRRVIGSVSASEFLVSTAASVGFLFGMASQLRELGVLVLGLFLGGVVAAPIAAWLVSRINPIVLGTLVGGLLVLLNLLRLGKTTAIGSGWITGAQIVVSVVTVILGFRVWRRSRAQQRTVLEVSEDKSATEVNAAAVEGSNYKAGVAEAAAKDRCEREAVFAR